MAAPRVWAPERRDVIWINFNPQLGKEMRDIHPLMVLSPKPFNERTGIVIGLPMTTASYNADNPFAIGFLGENGILSYVLTHQPKSFDWRLRAAKPHPMKRLPANVFNSVRESLNQIISLCD